MLEGPASPLDGIEVRIAADDGRETAYRLLADMTGRPGIAADIRRTPLGQPYLPNSSFGIGIARTRGATAVALRPDGPVGIDIEGRDSRAARQAARLCEAFTEPEAMFVRAGSAPDDRARRFLMLWTGKEAVLKACGLGISNGWNAAVFAAEPNGNLSLVRTPRHAAPPPAWTVAWRDVGGGAILAVAAPAPGNGGDQ